MSGPVPRRRSLVAAAIAAFVLLLEGLAAAAAGTASPTLPYFRRQPCESIVATPRTAECGYIVVAEDHDGTMRGAIELSVIVFRSAHPNKQDDPVVLVPGGPGMAVIKSYQEGHAYWGDWIASSVWLNKRDLILFDPRGVGLSRPSLDCPKAKSDLIAGFTTDEIRSEFSNACYLELSATGVDLSSYNSRSMAEDLHDIRQALDIREWNIWAESHGTRVALEAVRQKEVGIRSVILSGIVGSRVSDPLVQAKNFDAIIQLGFKLCAENEKCKRIGVSDKRTLHAAFDALRRVPLRAVIDLPGSHTSQPYAIDDRALWDIIHYFVQTQYGIRTLPLLTTLALHGRVKGIDSTLRWQLDLMDWQSMGAAFLVACNDEPPRTAQRVEEAAAQVPYLERWIRFKWIPGSCDPWRMSQLPAIESGPVESDLPVLILAGQLDPSRPSEGSEQVARHLSRSHLFVFKNQSSDVTGDPCAQVMLGLFLDDPFSAPYTPCFDQRPELRVPLD